MSLNNALMANFDPSFMQTQLKNRLADLYGTANGGRDGGFSLSAFTLAAETGISAAASSAGGSAASEVIAQFDADGDGKISKPEVEARLMSKVNTGFASHFRSELLAVQEGGSLFGLPSARDGFASTNPLQPLFDALGPNDRDRR
ncbi:hypothetical protein JM93_01418 [Roseibium hamelinense]|uniref:EF-hand domain-containing protein n=1 Tax=Roseibium hamelinense TaxID=150831 RepID=A0A562TBN7_9HYPH|nr:hypothetical protein [Roseibium hamelinense]MTI45201.1 hypothetical protein [Roseibium hamelinense]TWI90436.1 hypothetical protein JM93_01418 [Roseibium hamelinense]